MGFEIKDGILVNYTEEKGVTNIIIPDDVTSISDNAFSRCTRLTDIKVSENNKFYCDVNGVLFNKNKTKIILYPKARTEKIYIIPNSVKIIGNNSFYNCQNLTGIIIPDSVKIIGRIAFADCKNLTDISIPKSIESIGEIAFDGTLWLKKYPRDAVIINNILYKYKRNPTAFVIPNGIKVISDWAFNCCTRLSDIIIPDSVTVIGQGAFHGCTSLTHITIPNNVTSIKLHAFHDCTGLISITVPNGVTNIGDHTFQRCTNLASITMSGIESIGRNAFEGCYSLTSIVIPNSVTYIDSEAFKNCNGIKIITIPNNRISICLQAFYYCKNLTDIIIPYDDMILTLKNTPNGLTTIINGYNVPIKPIKIESKNESLKNAVDMLRTKNFSRKFSPEIKFILIVDYFFVSDDRDAETYIRRNSGKIMKQFIKDHERHYIDKILDETDFITKRHIDKLIYFAGKHSWIYKEIYLKLKDYKEKLSL